LKDKNNCYLLKLKLKKKLHIPLVVMHAEQKYNIIITYNRICENMIYIVIYLPNVLLFYVIPTRWIIVYKSILFITYFNFQ